MEITQEPTFEVELTDMAFGGDAIGRVDGEVVFVPYGLPGERVRLQIGRRKRDYATGQIVDVLDPVAARVAARCPYFGTCGGCNWQHSDYPTQLAMKRQVVVDQLRRIGGFGDAEDLVRSPIGMLVPWEYRNHVRFSIGRKYGDVGYTYRQSHRLLPIDACHIAHPRLNEILRILQGRVAGLKANQVMVRYGCNTGDLLVQPALPHIEELESGQLSVTEEILHRRFSISAAAFFQVNTRRELRALPDQLALPWIEDREGMYSIADLLALTVLDRLQAQPEDVVVDAYCGVGTFSALLAPHVARIIGIEESPAAIKDALGNTADLDNARFITAKTEHVLSSLGEERVDAVVLDPARAGCEPPVIQAILTAQPRRIVYVSCDPATLSRDLRLLADGGYRVAQVEPIDMFPQTYHIESVTTLDRE